MENKALQCFNQIKESISEAGGRVKVSQLLEKLKEKGCSDVEKRSIISITVNEGGYTPEVEACPEAERCSCELEALFTVRKEGNDSIVEIYNPKKHGWWENGRMVRPPSAQKELPPINSLNINNYWHHLTLDCYFSWIQDLYKDSCSQASQEILNLIKEKQKEIFNAIEDKHLAKLKNSLRDISNKILEKLEQDRQDKRDFKVKFKVTSIPKASEDCIRNIIIPLIEKANSINSDNYIVELRNLHEKLLEAIQNEPCNSIGMATTSLILTIANPEFFMPLCRDMVNFTIDNTVKNMKMLIPQINTTPLSSINESSCKTDEKESTVSTRFVGGSINDSGDISCILETFLILNYFRIKAGIPTLFELFCPLVIRTKEEKSLTTNVENSSQIITGGNNMNKPKNMVLYGPPGTGKTYKAREEAKVISNGKSENVKFVTFHPSFAYENFIEGIWPEVEDRQINYTIRDGILKELSIEAIWNALKKKNKDKTKYEDKKKEVIDALKRMQNGEEKVEALFNFENAENFVLIIDEINRGNIPSIFGELISLIEENKRLGESEALITTLPYSREPFAVPKNLYIVGTMNTTDRSVVIMDAALRRRFHFEEIAPDPDLLNGIVINGIDVKKLLQKINEEITKIPYLGRDYQIGHSYFLELRKNGSLEKLVEILRKKVLPLLQEYFHGRWEDLEKVLGEKWKKFIDETGRITLKSVEDLSDREKVISLIKSIYSVNEERRQDERTDEDNN